MTRWGNTQFEMIFYFLKIYRYSENHFLLITMLLFGFSAPAQNDPAHRAIFSFVVVPDGEIIEVNQIGDEYYVALDAIGSALQEKGYLVKDISGLLNASELKYQLEENISTNHFELLAENALGDIVVTIKMTIEMTGDERRLNLFLLAKDGHTAERLASSGWLRSTQRRWPNLYYPISEVLKKEDALNLFVAKLDENINAMIAKGRLLDIQIETEDNGPILFDETIPEYDMAFSDHLLSWLKEKAVNENAHAIAGDAFTFRTEARLPIIDKNGRPKSPLEWGNEMVRFIQETIKTNYEKISLKVIGSQILVAIR